MKENKYEIKNPQLNIFLDSVDNYKEIYGENIALRCDEILDLEKIKTLIGAFYNNGFRRINIISTETSNLDIVVEVVCFSRHTGFEEIMLTTDGTGISDKIRDLSLAGLKRINFLVDTLKEYKYNAQTGMHLKEVFLSFELAESLGLEIFIVCMMMKGYNSDELFDFMALTDSKNANVIFHEVHCYNDMENYYEQAYFNVVDALYEVEGIFPDEEMSENRDEIMYFHLHNSGGTIGVFPSFVDGNKNVTEVMIDKYANMSGRYYPKEVVNVMNLLDRSDIDKELEKIIIENEF